MVVYWRDARWEELTVFVQSQPLLAVNCRLTVIRLEHRWEKTPNVSSVCTFKSERAALGLQLYELT